MGSSSTFYSSSKPHIVRPSSRLKVLKKAFIHPSLLGYVLKELWMVLVEADDFYYNLCIVLFADKLELAYLLLDLAYLVPYAYVYLRKDHGDIVDASHPRYRGKN